MKKTAALLLLFIIQGTSWGKMNTPSISLGFGGSLYSKNLGDASSLGPSMSLKIGNIYADLSSNFARNHGERSASLVGKYPTSLRQSLINAGYAFPTLIRELSLMPTIGLCRRTYIYQTEETYYNEKPLLRFNFGAMVNWELTDRIVSHVGMGFYDKFKIGISFRL